MPVSKKFHDYHKLNCFLLIFILLNTGCSRPREKCRLTYDSIIESSSRYVNTNSKKDELADKAYYKTGKGGNYKFNDNKTLKAYYFYTAEDSGKALPAGGEFIETPDYPTERKYYCSYAELYDSLGNFLKGYGNPLVFQNIRLNEDDTTLSFRLDFFTLDKVYDQIVLDLNNGEKYFLHLRKDSAFSNMSYVDFKTRYNFTTGFKAYVRFTYRGLCVSNYTNEVTDSVICKL